jgi:hypothetical protein
MGCIKNTTKAYRRRHHPTNRNEATQEIAHIYLLR